MVCNGCCRCSSRSTITWSSTVSGRRSGMPMRPAGWCSSPGTARSAIAGTSGSSTRPTWWSSSPPPGRSHEVPEEHLGPIEEGILVVDRYAAYQAMAQVKDGKILLAFCWAHVRRDFLTAARSWPDQEAWAVGWVDRIGVLYECNDRRLEVPCTTPLFTARDQEVRRCVTSMEQQREDELTQGFRK